MNIRGFLSELKYATSGDILEGWEDITVFEDVLEQVVVAETCKSPFLSVEVTDIR